ncbi:MAG: hypothetical protein ACRD0A_03645 [Acidimicrobiales bacterium]
MASIQVGEAGQVGSDGGEVTAEVGQPGHGVGHRARCQGGLASFQVGEERGQQAWADPGQAPLVTPGRLGAGGRFGEHTEMEQHDSGGVD